MKSSNIIENVKIKIQYKEGIPSEFRGNYSTSGCSIPRIVNYKKMKK